MISDDQGSNLDEVNCGMTTTSRHFTGLFTATVQGHDVNGGSFETNVLLDGHLDGDLYLKVSEKVEARTELFIVLRLLPSVAETVPAVRVALHGLVDRVNILTDGEYDLRVAILDCQSL